MKLELANIITPHGAAQECGTRLYRLARQRAFTLVEVTLTVGLLLLVISSSLSALVFLNRSSARLADHTAAMAAVHGRIEAIRAASYNPPNAPFYTAAPVNITNQVQIALSKSGTNYLVPGTIISTITPVASGHLVSVSGTFQARGQSMVLKLESLVNRFAGGQQ